MKNKINKTIHLIDFDSYNKEEKLNKVLSDNKKSLSEVYKNKGLNFISCSDSSNPSISESLELFVESSFGNFEDLPDIYEIGDSKEFLKLSFRELRAESCNVIVLETSNWSKYSDYQKLLEIDEILAKKRSFCFLVWIRRDWNEYYRRKFQVLFNERGSFFGDTNSTVNDFEFTKKRLLRPNKIKIEIEDIPSSRKASFLVMNKVLQEGRVKSILPPNVSDIKTRTPSEYNELLEIASHLLINGHWNGNYKIERFYETWPRSRSTLERKVSILKYIRENIDSFDFCL